LVGNPTMYSTTFSSRKRKAVAPRPFTSAPLAFPPPDPVPDRDDPLARVYQLFDLSVDVREDARECGPVSERGLMAPEDVSPS